MVHAQCSDQSSLNRFSPRDEGQSLESRVYSPRALRIGGTRWVAVSRMNGGELAGSQTHG